VVPPFFFSFFSLFSFQISEVKMATTAGRSLSVGTLRLTGDRHITGVDIAHLASVTNFQLTGTFSSNNLLFNSGASVLLNIGKLDVDRFGTGVVSNSIGTLQFSNVARMTQEAKITLESPAQFNNFLIYGAASGNTVFKVQI
jgi:hypothetical protein